MEIDFNALLPESVKLTLAEAIKSQSFFITIHYDTKEPGNDLQHLYYRQGYNPNDVIASLKHVATDFETKELIGLKAWH